MPKLTSPPALLVPPIKEAPPTQVPATRSPAPADSYADRILELVNAERAEHRLGALRVSSCAEGYAQRWADQLADRGVLEHQTLQPILAGCQASGTGENIAYGNISAEKMMELWMGSPGHRANILKAGYTHLGVGATKTGSGRWYASQVFLTL